MAKTCRVNIDLKFCLAAGLLPDSIPAGGGFFIQENK
jgi:hypothetical protein